MKDTLSQPNLDSVQVGSVRKVQRGMPSNDLVLTAYSDGSDKIFPRQSNGELTEGVAGRLVRMAEGQAVTFKLTEKLADMHPIEELPDRIRAIA